ncbi:hypothetical protein DL768_002814 [Monosporascus sp. mg162]|nr:hypothetical protein DL768_002814 [Monosporascus sp. mg162]
MKRERAARRNRPAGQANGRPSHSTSTCAAATCSAWSRPRGRGMLVEALSYRKPPAYRFPTAVRDVAALPVERARGVLCGGVVAAAGQDRGSESSPPPTPSWTSRRRRTGSTPTTCYLGETGKRDGRACISTTPSPSAPSSTEDTVARRRWGL